MLGPTVANIAWHKAGIFKPGAAALSTVQGEAGVGAMLGRRAGEKGVELNFVDEEPDLPTHSPQLEPPVQRQNASLAVAACRAWLQHPETQPRNPTPNAQLSPADIAAGIAQFAWPGRFQTLTLPSPHPADDRTTFHLDAAHNALSARLAAQWFATATASPPAATRVLLFTHLNALRSGTALLHVLARALRDAGVAAMHGAVFTTYEPTRRGEEEGGGVPSSFREIWHGVFPDSMVEERTGIDEAVECARRMGGRVSEGGGGGTRRERHVLVTGSQHLVGPVLRILEAEGAGKDRE